MQFKVRAKSLGYYNKSRIREGTVFIVGEDAFPKDKDGALLKDEKGNYVPARWMELIEADKPIKSARGAKLPKPEETKEESANSDEVI